MANALKNYDRKEGDFMCNVKKEMTIEGWEPKVCVCPKK